MVHRLVEHCVRYERMQELLSWSKRKTGPIRALSIISQDLNSSQELSLQAGRNRLKP